MYYDMLSMVNMLPILGVLCLMFAVTECSNPCDTAQNVDGCSIPGGLSFWYKDVFEPDCNKHDVCYQCGSALSVSRDQCDGRFFSNMKSTCNTDDTVKVEWWCRSVAFVYYIGVHRFGSGYTGTSPAWCNDAWVPDCMS